MYWSGSAFASVPVGGSIPVWSLFPQYRLSARHRLGVLRTGSQPCRAVDQDDLWKLAQGMPKNGGIQNPALRKAIEKHPPKDNWSLSSPRCNTRKPGPLMLDDKLEIRNVCNIKKRYFTPSHVPSQYDSDHDGKTKWHGPNLPLLLYSLAREP